MIDGDASSWPVIVGLTLMAGLAMPAGALIARVERIQSRWLEEEFRHGVVAFGGGALLSAVALVLVPEGAAELPPTAVALCFGGGGVTFMALDLFLAARKSATSQLVAMLSDFIPEAMALGATLAVGGEAGLLLAGLMALQNLPEGFNAYRELTASTALRPGRVIGAFALMALLGPAAGLAGFFWLAAYPALVAGVMLFAGGGILYLVFEDIAPQAVLEKRWAPPLGAVAGFLLGLLGQMLTGA